MPRRWLWWIVGLPVALVVLVSAGTWFYLHVIEGPAPARLTLDGATTSTIAASTTVVSTDGAGTTVDGTWKVTTGSQAGYRVAEVLNGQSATAVGRTSAVTGTITISGTSVAAGTFSVDLTKVASDQSRRDGQFQGRIMQTSSFPTATFELTQPIDVGRVPADGGKVSATATGRLTLHGVTKVVAIPVDAERSGATIRVAGSLPVHFADFGISNPSAGPAQVGADGEMEFLLVLAHA